MYSVYVRFIGHIYLCYLDWLDWSVFIEHWAGGTHITLEWVGVFFPFVLKTKYILYYLKESKAFENGTQGRKLRSAKFLCRVQPRWVFSETRTSVDIWQCSSRQLEIIRYRIRNVYISFSWNLPRDCYYDSQAPHYHEVGAHA